MSSSPLTRAVTRPPSGRVPAEFVGAISAFRSRDQAADQAFAAALRECVTPRLKDRFARHLVQRAQELAAANRAWVAHVANFGSLTGPQLLVHDRKRLTLRETCIACAVMSLESWQTSDPEPGVGIVTTTLRVAPVSWHSIRFLVSLGLHAIGRWHRRYLVADRTEVKLLAALSIPADHAAKLLDGPMPPDRRFASPDARW